MDGSFSTLREAEIKFKMPELNVSSYNSAIFHVTTKKVIMMLFFVEIYFRNWIFN